MKNNKGKHKDKDKYKHKGIYKYKGKYKNNRQTCDGLGARGAPLREELAEALGAVRLVVAAREPLTSQRPEDTVWLSTPQLFPLDCSICPLCAIGAGEALPVPRLVPVSHPACCDHLKSFKTSISFLSPSGDLGISLV